MQALNDYVIVQPKEKDKKTKAGIIIPNQEEEYKNEGTVVNFGDDVKGLSEGDEILFKDLSYIEFERDSQLYYIIRKYDIFINFSK